MNLRNQGILLHFPILPFSHSPISPDPYEQFDSPYAANFNNPANFADPSGGTSYFFCEIGEALNFGNVTGVASTSTALITSAGIIKDINQGLGSAGAELMQEYVNATGGPGGYVWQITGDNMGSYAWDPAATPDTPNFIPPGKWLWLSSGECLYYTSQTDVHVEVRTLETIDIVSTPTMSTAAKVMLALDIVENFVPGLNLLFAAGKAAYYLSQGNIAEVGWAVAGVFGGDIIRAAYTVCKAGVKAVKYSYKAVKVLAAPTKAVKKVDEVVAAVDEVAEVATKKADDIWYKHEGTDGVVSYARNKPDSDIAYSVVNGADEVVEEGGDFVKVYRVFGDGADAMGKSWTPHNPMTFSDYRFSAGLPDVNTGRFVIEGLVKKSDINKYRSALPCGVNEGGIMEYLIYDSSKIFIQRVSGVNPQF